jgi:hypothetical protein|tara:strand:- start:71 stop:415 length:345 start_codon:yes stop_codon:yes gene_type:complete
MTTEVERLKLDLDLPPVVVLEQIDWKVITEGNQEQVFAELKKANIDPVLFSLTDDDYELLQKNNVQLRNQIVRLVSQLKAYKEYYEPKEQESKTEKNKSFTKTDFEPKDFSKDD